MKQIFINFLTQARLICFLILLSGSLSTIAYGQAPKIVPVAPEAAALAKIVNYGVNLNTGVPEISVPLYQIETGGMVLPIGLQYHSGGFRINERATSVGLGFSLSCDIQITRTVNGLDDLDPYHGYIANTKVKAHRRESNADDYTFTNPGDYFIAQNTKFIVEGVEDGMPDKFNYRLLNKAGSFYFQKNDYGNGYTIVPVPYDNNIKITYNNNFTNSAFTITDSDGTAYYFTVREQLTAGSATNPYTAWKCSEIQNAAQTESIFLAYRSKESLKNASHPEYIEYSNDIEPCGLTTYYTTDEIITLTPNITTYNELVALYPPQYLSSPKYKEYFASGRPTLFHLPYLDALNKVNDKTYTDNQSVLSSTTTSAMVLSKISFRGGNVIFNGTDQLYSIRIEDASGGEIKTFHFIQSYTTPDYLPSARLINGAMFNGTLYLDAIEARKDTTVSEKYAFKYERKYCFGSHLVGKDAWGYPNDYTRDMSGTNPDYIPTTVPHQQIKQKVTKDTQGGCPFADNVVFDIGNSTNTEIPSSKASLGILSRIIYPTGGYVDFNFEGNKYNQLNTDYAVKAGGGLRVKNINYYDGKSELPVSQKYYKYGELEDGVGLVVSAPGNSYNYTTNDYDPYSYSKTTAYIASVDAKTTKTTTYSPASSLSYTYANGAPIYYTKVTEYNSDLGINTGKKVYTFYPPGQFSLVDNRTKVAGTNVDVLHTDGLMGKQKSLKEYKFENGKYALLHSKEFEYTKYSRDQQVKVVYAYQDAYYEFSGSFDEQYRKDFLNGHSYGMYTTGEYGIEVGTLLLTSEKEEWINSGSTLSQLTTYNYDGHLQLGSIESINSKGHQMLKTLNYPYDYTENVYTQMVSKNMISQPIEEIVRNITLNKEISRSKTNFGVITIDPLTSFIAPLNLQKSVGGAPIETLVTFDQYDQFANILQITGKDGLPASYLWGYNQKYLLAEVKGAPYTTVTSAINPATLQNITDAAQLRTSLNTLRTSLNQPMISSFTHKPLVGLSSQTSPSGRISYYDYDKHGRLAVIRDQNNDIVKKYDYSMLNSTSASGLNTFYYTNAPVMETFYKFFDNQTFQPYNYIVAGGKYRGYYASLTDMQVNEELAAIVPVDGGKNCSAPQNLAKITMYNRGVQSAYLDLIQDGAVVASKPFPAFGTRPEDLMAFKEFYVPVGEYQISLRLEGNNYQGRVVCNISGDSISSTNLNAGDKVNLLPGKSYGVMAYKSEN